ncbi:MAG: chloride channel protein [Eubacteriales bacterium]|nr:chloride channel protein [Eubacteriales bacterium]
MNTSINNDDKINDINNNDLQHNPASDLGQLKRIHLASATLLKWLACSIICGIAVGCIGALFSIVLNCVTAFRSSHDWIIFLLPLSGLIIVLLYHWAGVEKSQGTNLVINAIHSNEEVPIYVAPLIIVSTIITHLFGGSAGREGAALQVGGSIGNFFGRLLKFDDKDTRILIMCGMSACFSALFGTPLAAAIFSMEVISVGVMYYAALVPCVLSALIADGVAGRFGLIHELYNAGDIPALSFIMGAKIVFLGIIFAVISIFFCMGLHKASDLYNRFFSNSYIKILVAGLLVIILRFLFQTTDYLGAGTGVIEESFINSCAWYVFILKIIFTAVTLGGGFKGGEIVPALFVGATLGSFLAPVFGLPIGLCAACGMVSVFCGATNCPLTSLLMSIEMFGLGSVKYCFISISISYLLSGYYSLYHSQKIVYSKYKTTYINRQSH